MTDDTHLKSQLALVSKAVINAAAIVGGTQAEILGGIALALASAARTYGDGDKQTLARLVAAMEIVDMARGQERQVESRAVTGEN